MRAWSRPVSAKSAEENKTAARAARGETSQITLDDWLSPAPDARLVLSFSNDRARKRFLKLAEQEGIAPLLRFDEKSHGLFALVSPFRKGLFLPSEHMLVLGEDVLQPRVERGRKVPQGAFQGLDRYDTLRGGDLLVHRDYGIGIFKGLHRMGLGGD